MQSKCDSCHPAHVGRASRFIGEGMSGEFQEIVQFSPAYDRRSPDPKKNYGIHGVELGMVLKGPKGAVQFLLFTNWQLPHVTAEIDKRTIEAISAATKPKRRVARWNGVHPDQIAGILNAVETAIVPYEEGERQLRCFHRPLPADLGCHSPKPMYPDQKPMGAEKFDFDHMETLKGLSGDIKIPTMVETGTFTPCEYLDGHACYYDGSTLNAERIYQVLLTEGSAGVWRELREYYDSTFGKG